jgi:hypothetical protein
VKLGEVRKKVRERFIAHRKNLHFARSSTPAFARCVDKKYVSKREKKRKLIKGAV